MAAPLFLALLSAAVGKPAPMNAYTFVPGNWTELVDALPVVYPIVAVGDPSRADPPGAATFAGEYNGLALEITVTSNTTGNGTYGAHEFSFELVHVVKEFSIAEVDVSDGSHVTVSAEASGALEFSIFPNDADGLLSFAFFKPQEKTQKWWHAAIPVVAAVACAWAVRRYVPGIMG
jgi:hypothetical protein